LESAGQLFTRNIRTEVAGSPDYDVADHHANESLSGIQITAKNARYGFMYMTYLQFSFRRTPSSYFIISKGPEQDPLVDALTNVSSTFMILFVVDLDQVYEKLIVYIESNRIVSSN
jgi:hypothetical protein